MKDSTETITISIPTHLLQMLDIAAQQFDYSRSKYISHAVRDKLVSTFYKNSSYIREEFYSAVIRNFQTRNVP